MTAAHINRREQIAKQIKLQKIAEIHKFFDKDNDGYLNYAELSSLQIKTTKDLPSTSAGEDSSENNSISRSKYKTICTALGCKPNKGLDLRALIFTYESGGGADYNRDYDAVFGIKRTSKKKVIKQNGGQKRQQQPIGRYTNQTNRTSPILQAQNRHFTRTPTNSPIRGYSNSNPASPSSQQPVYSSSNCNLIGLLKNGNDPVIKRSNTKSFEPPNLMDFIDNHPPVPLSAYVIAEEATDNVESKDRAFTSSMSGSTISDLDVHSSSGGKEDDNICQKCRCSIM